MGVIISKSVQTFFLWKENSSYSEIYFSSEIESKIKLL